MRFFELEPTDITALNDSDLRELLARLCEAELIRQGIQPSCVLWGGAQEAADGGLDVRVKDATSLSGPSFIPSENTGFQVKKNSMGKAACAKEMLDKGTIKPVITELACQKGAYIIVSGKDDCSDRMLSERILGMESATEYLPQKDDLLLDFYGRDRLASWLRQHPGVSLWARSRLGKPLSGWESFGRWAKTPTNQNDDFLLDDHPCITDLNSQQKEPVTIAEGLKLTRDRLRHHGSTVRITGLSGVGKTRFAQALFETNVGENALPSANVIYADLGTDLTPSASELVSYLISNDFSSCLVLDNCPPDVHRNLQKQVSSNNAKLCLLTIEYDISDDKPEETKVIHMEPSSEETVSKLIQKRFPSLGRLDADKVAEFSGGNARVAIALSSRVEADETLTNFSDEDLFQRLFSQRKGASDNLLESAEVLSLVYSFNTSKSEFNDELGVLSTIGDLSRRTLHKGQAELLRRQLAQQRGSWRAVLPHALANRLARRALENIPAEEINSELFKLENRRLLKSCAHRLGYLHDFEPARQLAESWVLSGGPLHNIASCNAELLAVLDYIAPVFPETVLVTIEEASKDTVFASRSNEHFSVFVNLLGHLAYDDESFDRSARLILKFAETEKLGENYDGIVTRFKGLFSLRLSGTHATPARRQAFLSELVSSGNPRHLEIASELLQSAFEASRWTSFGSFGFGARSRDYGWVPKTGDEELDWYIGFVGILKPLLTSKDERLKRWAKEQLASNFRGLWSYAGCFDILEEIICHQVKTDNWPEIWMSIKQTISFDGEKHSEELLARLESLERLSAPADPYAEIEAYALVDTWDHHTGDEEGSYKDIEKRLHNKIVSLGEFAACEPDCLKKLAPRLWEKHIDALWHFGNGLATGSADQNATFEYLVKLMQAQTLERVQPILFTGFIRGVHHQKPDLVRQLLERALEIPELKPLFVGLLGAIPIAPWGAKKLIELARSGELEAWRFEQLRYGRTHQAISDNDLFELLSSLNTLEGGVFSTLRILIMRFRIDKDRDYLPPEILRAVGRDAVLELLSMHRKVIKQSQLIGIDRILDEILHVKTPTGEISKIIEVLCEGIESFRLYRFESVIEKISDTLIKNFPELILNRVFSKNDKEDQLSYLLFRGQLNRRGSSLNIAPIDSVIEWCDGIQERIQKVATAVSSYSSTDKNKRSMENPQQVVLSIHIKELLEIADDKNAIIETIFSRTWPGSWSGSLANILATRSRAFAELLNHPSLEVRDLAKIKLGQLEEAIRKNRSDEAERNSEREQRFE